jgi:hypothetical protein
MDRVSDLESISSLTGPLGKGELHEASLCCAAGMRLAFEAST